MDFRQLRSFLEVIRQDGFTAAAQVLNMSQSAVSKQVAQLEQSLDTQLLERQGSRLRLTAAGRIVAQHAEQLAKQRQALLDELADLGQLNPGELRLGLPMMAGNALFAGLFAQYRERYPNIDVHLLEGGSRHVEAAVLDGKLEVGGALTPTDPAFDFVPFCNEPLDVLLPAEHPLAHNRDVRLEELAQTPFLLYERGFLLNDRLMQACRQQGFVPREAGRSSQADFLAALVAAGQGVVLLPSVVARALVRPGVVRLTLTAPASLRWDIAFIWRRGAYLSKAAQAWLALVGERRSQACKPAANSLIQGWASSS